LSEYAEGLGMLFQITDDMLDITGNEKTLGKQPGSDLKKRKISYPSLYGLEKSLSLAEEACALSKEAVKPLSGGDLLSLFPDYFMNRKK
jgi:geranylgeranyl diphosphate synthase type II